MGKSAKLSYLSKAISTSKRATELAPNSLSLSTVYASTLLELIFSKLLSEDEVLSNIDILIAECERGISIDNPDRTCYDLEGIERVDQPLETLRSCRLKSLQLKSQKEESKKKESAMLQAADTAASSSDVSSSAQGGSQGSDPHVTSHQM